MYVCMYGDGSYMHTYSLETAGLWTLLCPWMHSYTSTPVGKDIFVNVCMYVCMYVVSMRDYVALMGCIS